MSGSCFQGKHVIGFTKYITTAVARQDPGVVRCSEDDTVHRTCNPISHHKDNIIDEYSIYAKWSYNGKIIKLPYNEAGIKEKGKVIIGAKNVLKAIKAPNARKIIEVIYSVKEPPFPKPLQKVWPEIMGEFNKFRYYERTKKDMDKLAGNNLHEGIIALCFDKPISKYKCCPECKGKKDFRHRCPELLRKYPNGPLE